MDRIDTLAAFVAVSEERSFVAAARRLGRSPAAITRTIAELEARLGTRLFTRTTRAVVPTDAGRRYLEPSRQIVRDFAALESRLASERQEPQGSLSVTASIVFGRLHVLPIVSDFLRRYPSIDVRMRLSDSVLPLVEEEIDVGVRIAHLPDSTLKAIRVGTVRRAVYASPAYLAAHGEPRAPGDLATHACVAFTGSTPVPDRWSFGRGRSKVVVPLAPRLAVNLAEPAIDAATAGLGVTCVLSYMVDHLVTAGLLRPVLRLFEPPPIPVQVVYPAGRHQAATARLLIDALVAGLRAKFAAAPQNP